MMISQQAMHRRRLVSHDLGVGEWAGVVARYDRCMSVAWRQGCPELAKG